MSDCTHDLSERETAVADGYCPMCLVSTIEQQEAEKLDQLRDLSIAFSRVEELEARVDDLEAQLHKLLLSRAGARVFTPNSVPKEET